MNRPTDRTKAKAILRYHDIKTSAVKRYVLALEKQANGKKAAKIMKLRDQIKKLEDELETMRLDKEEVESDLIKVRDTLSEVVDLAHQAL
jgi:TolA-binding protein